MYTWYIFIRPSFLLPDLFGELRLFVPPSLCLGTLVLDLGALGAGDFLRRDGLGDGAFPLFFLAGGRST